jgi:FkbM family methyltransferase
MLGRYKILLDTRDMGLSPHLLLDGFWELWLTRFIARRIKPGMTTFDVGANFGYFTLLLGGLVGPAGKVLACEPNPVAAANLRRSVRLNGHVDRTTVVEAALGASGAPEAVLFVPNEEPKNAHVISSPGDADPTLGAICCVMQTTLDQIAAELRRVDFIKVDAEGAEEQILIGMLDTLGRHKPCLILEFNGFRSKDARALLCELMSIYGTLQYLDFDGKLLDTTIEHLTADRGNVDWLLHFDGSRRV